MKRIIIKGNCLDNSLGKIEISPAKELILYFFENNKSVREIPLKLTNLSVENHTITIGHKLKVVEHLFSALYGLDIFKVKIDFYSNGVPIFDGSSYKFVEMLSQFSADDNIDFCRIDKKICIQYKNSFISYEPTNGNELFIDMELEHPYIGRQNLSLILNRETYINEIAPARTFIFTDDADLRLKNLPPYGIGITQNGIYSNEPLRFPDEPLRHKILDLLGDLFFLQKKLCGKIKARNTYHQLNLEFGRQIFTIHNLNKIDQA